MGVEEAVVRVSRGAAVIGTRVKTKVSIYLQEFRVIVIRDKKVVVWMVNMAKNMVMVMVILGNDTIAIFI